MSIKYNWRCQVCDSAVEAGNDNCTICNSPASLNAEEFETYKAQWRATQATKKEKKEFKCVKCEHTEFEHGQFRASGGGLSAIFEIENKRFVHITCKNCGYTELYKSDVSVAESVIDFLVG